PGEEERARHHHQRMTAAPQARPPPNAENSRRSSALSLPCSTASSSAMGSEADEVLPYLSMFRKKRSMEMPTRSETPSMMRRLAWWANTQLTSATLSPLASRAASEALAMLRTACLYTSRPFIFTYCCFPATSSGVSGVLVPP